jgi:hypothetical protein
MRIAAKNFPKHLISCSVDVVISGGFSGGYSPLSVGRDGDRLRIRRMVQGGRVEDAQQSHPWASWGGERGGDFVRNCMSL